MLINGKWMDNITCRCCHMRHPAELTCDEARAHANAGRKERAKQQCECELCGKPTFMLATRRCDACWELERRIEAQPDLARKILAALPGGL